MIPRSPAHFPDQPLEEEELLPVQGAQPLIVCGEILRRDFPELSSMDDEALGSWLATNAAWISKQQADQEVVNTKIPVLAPGRRAWRPPRYGRAAVIPVIGAHGLLDVKGIGVRAQESPRLARAHENGLVDLREALYEMIFQRLIEAALIAEGLSVRTVPCYGIVDLGFQVKWPHEENTRAVVLVRRAHTRPRELWGDLDPSWELAHLMLETEVALRRWGLSSSGGTMFTLSEYDGQLQVAFRHTPQINLSLEEQRGIRERCRFQGGRMQIEGVNLQHTHHFAELFDFGGFRAVTDRQYPIYAPASARYERLFGPILHPDAPGFPTARGEPRVPLWANEAGANLARAFEQERFDRQALVAGLLAVQAELLSTFARAGTPLIRSEM